MSDMEDYLEGGAVGCSTQVISTICFFNKVIWTSLKSEYVPTQAVFDKLFMNIRTILEEHTNQQ
jgi:hypothetical protein